MFTDYDIRFVCTIMDPYNKVHNPNPTTNANLTL